jgi:TatD DNase family protein
VDVRRVITIGTELADSTAAAEIAANHRGIYAAVGVHPHDAEEFSAKDLGAFEVLLQQPSVVAVGEVGLDYYRDHSPRDVQKDVFAMMADMALSSGKPLLIHSREAAADTVAVLDSIFKDKSHPIIFHCFSGDKLLLEWGMKRDDCYFSFAGNVTYPKAVQLHEALRAIPLDRLLIETDAPYLAPSKMRGKQNEPSYVPMTAAYVAEAKGVAGEELAGQLEVNFTNIFGTLEHI